MSSFAADGIILSDVKGLGLSAIATKSFEVGDIVLIERPLLVFDPRDNSSIVQGFLACSKQAQNQLLHLFCPAFTLPDCRLADNIEETSPLPSSVRAEAHSLLQQFSQGDSSCQLVFSDVFRLLMAIRLNAHEFCCDDCESGVSRAACFEIASKMAHSCAPNLSFSAKCMTSRPLDVITAPPMNGATPAASPSFIEYRAISPIRAGDLLTISYLSARQLRKSTLIRRRLLRRDYLFFCCCPRCTQPDWARTLRCPHCNGPLVRFDTNSGNPFDSGRLSSTGLAHPVNLHRPSPLLSFSSSSSIRLGNTAALSIVGGAPEGPRPSLPVFPGEVPAECFPKGDQPPSPSSSVSSSSACAAPSTPSSLSSFDYDDDEEDGVSLPDEANSAASAAARVDVAVSATSGISEAQVAATGRRPRPYSRDEEIKRARRRAEELPPPPPPPPPLPLPLDERGTGTRSKEVPPQSQLPQLEPLPLPSLIPPPPLPLRPLPQEREAEEVGDPSDKSDAEKPWNCEHCGACFADDDDVEELAVSLEAERSLTRRMTRHLGHLEIGSSLAEVCSLSMATSPTMVGFFLPARAARC